MRLWLLSKRCLESDLFIQNFQNGAELTEFLWTMEFFYHESTRIFSNGARWSFFLTELTRFTEFSGRWSFFTTNLHEFFRMVHDGAFFDKIDKIYRVLWTIELFYHDSTRIFSCGARWSFFLTELTRFTEFSARWSMLVAFKLRRRLLPFVGFT